MRHKLVLTAAIAALSVAAPALAQQPSPTLINVSIGPGLQQKASDYGPRELSDISRDLRDTVQSAVLHSRAPPPARIDLVIEDAVPNRPTFDQLGRTVGLSYRSIGLGGARISGVVTYPDGAQRPVHEQFYETDLREERGVGTWSDADRAFEEVGYAIGHAKFRTAFAGPGPGASGHFGYPFTSQ